jgi:Xaa-Pro aminopeptidase
MTFLEKNKMEVRMTDSKLIQRSILSLTLLLILCFFAAGITLGEKTSEEYQNKNQSSLTHFFIEKKNSNSIGIFSDNNPRKTQSEINFADMFRNRRKRLMDKINEGMAFIQSSGSSEYNPLLWDKNLEYLTGLTSKKAVLLLAPGGITVDQYETFTGPEVGRGRKVQEVLFIEEISPIQEMIDGKVPTIEEVKKITGVEKIYELSRMNGILQWELKNEDVLWCNKPSVSITEPLPSDLLFLKKIRDRFFWLKLKNIAPKIHEMRRVKEPYEVECLRKAFQIHTDIYEKIMVSLKPGKNESLGQAIFDYELQMRSSPNDIKMFAKKVSGALDKHEASIIIASGKNSTIAHYTDNNKEIKDGDLVLIDTGVSYRGYSSDITRTFPANGKFTPRQKELYSIVLEAQKLAIKTMKPGSTARQAHKAVYDHFKKYNLEKYGYGICGHPVGLNIHDANGDFDIPFEPGVVIVIEPFLSIPTEEIGIRIEDGVLITKEGHELLPGPPKEIGEVEALCSRTK